MQNLQIEVFPKTSTRSMLRLKDHEGTLIKERPLDADRIDQFISEIQDGYRQVSPVLRELGHDLYTFLDGDDRWLGAALDDPSGTVLHIDADERLRHLPWELMAPNGEYLAIDIVKPFSTVVRVSDHASEVERANRELRILLMATSPEDVQPVLEFEREEGLILDATRDAPVELFVEESGSLAGLKFISRSYGKGYFDVLHLSGHADVNGDQPVFLLEDDEGHVAPASATDIATALENRWPRLVFLSGCKTGSAPQDGALPSMSEALVEMGAPCVLGWSLPVGDQSANLLASFLYERLAAGMRIDEAVARARGHLWTEDSPFWHLLRLYANGTPLGPLVSPPNEPGRMRSRRPPTDSAFLDDEGKVKVASREDFVGRRRVIQRSLRALRRQPGAPDTIEGLLLRGMGGLGKSTLASRLVERMATHQSVIWIGKLDELEVLKLPSRIKFDDMAAFSEANEILNRPDASLADRIRYLLHGPLQALDCLFVIDDFEDGNLEPRGDGYVLTPDAAEIVQAFLEAIRSTGSRSRVIITSRYDFAPPAGARLHIEALESMKGPELEKKLRQLTAIGPDGTADPAVRDRAVEASSGIPRLLEWLDQLVLDEHTDIDALLETIESKASEFREDVLAQELLDAQHPDVKRMLAFVDVFDLPVPRVAIDAVAEGPDVDTHLERSAAVGLIEVGTDAMTSEPRYFVNHIVSPLLADAISDEERTAACAAGARALYEVWVENEPT